MSDGIDDELMSRRGRMKICRRFNTPWTTARMSRTMVCCKKPDGASKFKFGVNSVPDF